MTAATTPFTILHDPSHAEDVAGDQYIVAKVFNANVEIGSIKLAIGTDDGTPIVKIHLHGKLIPDPKSSGGIGFIVIKDTPAPPLPA